MKRITNRIKLYFADSYHSDRTAFYFEFVSFVFTVATSLSLAVYASDPNMALIYPGFFIGSVTGTYAYYRRNLPWPMLLTAYFCVINVFGWGVAMSFW